MYVQQEMEEETGYKSKHVEYLLSLRTTVAFCDAFIDVYVATDLEQGKRHLDNAESIDVEIYTLDELCQMIYEGEVQDSKTVAAIMAYSNKIKRLGHILKKKIIVLLMDGICEKNWQ